MCRKKKKQKELGVNIVLVFFLIRESGSNVNIRRKSK